MKSEAHIEDKSYLEFTLLVNSDEFKTELYRALSTMGKSKVRKEYRHLWNEKHPYIGYCYVVTELLYHLSDRKISPKVLPTVEGNHWYAELMDGNIKDLTRDREYDYSKGKRRSFITYQMSARAKELKELMGL